MFHASPNFQSNSNIISGECMTNARNFHHHVPQNVQLHQINVSWFLVSKLNRVAKKNRWKNFLPGKVCIE